MNMIKPRSDIFLQLKFFLIFFCPFAILISGVTFALYYFESNSDKLIAETREKYTLSLLAQIVTNDFKTVLSDLMILSTKNELQAMLIRTSGIDAHRKALAQEYLHYAARKKIYDQIRFLNAAGMERVRINFNKGAPLIVTDSLLQSKSQRYYFKETFQLKRDEIFISPFDLNIEHGTIELPLKPMIRFGTPVFDMARQKRGIVLVNYRGATLIRNLERSFVNSPGILMLLNKDGYWLKGPISENEWGFMYENRKNKTFGNAFSEAWRQISAHREGTFYTTDGLFTFTTVSPLSIAHQFRFVDKDYTWKIVSHIKPAVLDAMSQKAFNKLVTLNSLLIPLLALLSLILTHAIVKRKAMEESLTEERNLLRTLIDAVPYYVKVKDLHGRYIILNKTVIRFLKNKTSDEPDENELLGKKDSDFFPPETAKQYDIEDLHIIESGKSVIDREETFADKKGDVNHQMATSKIPLKNSRGKIRGLLEFSRDITEHKETEEKLRLAKEAAETANLAKSEFLANMSHEIRTPMNAVLGFTEILNDLITDPLQKKYLKSIENSGQTLMMLINDILDLSKIEAGKTDIYAKPFSLFTVIRELSRIFDNKITEKGLEWDVKIASDFPANLVLDEIRIRQVLFNLIGNAVKFTDSGSILLEARAVFSDHEPEQCKIVLAVTDTGDGIADDQKALIFEAFTQQNVHSARQYEGTGLGLAISKRLVEMMGGAITLKSEPGKGSRFEIVLPNVTIDQSEDVSLRQKPRVGRQLNFESTTLLVVDDVRTNRMMLKAFLRDTGISVLEAENGEKALAMAKLHIPDMILLDIRMNGMDGYEVMERLKTADDLKTIPVVAFTAAAAKQDRDKIIDHGFDGYLYKPVRRSELLRQITRHLSYAAIEETGGKPSPPIEKTEEFSTLASEHSSEISAEISVEAMAFLNGDLTELWKAVRRSGSFEEIEAFANKVSSFGLKYNLDRFNQFGNNLTMQVETFEVDGIEKSMELFPRLADK